MTANTHFDDSGIGLGREEKLMAMAKMSLEQLLYYVLVELTGKHPEPATA
jgi:hypothetical protein